MNFETLITAKRLGVLSQKSHDKNDYRSTFQKDFDRLVFSAAFRRLQDKTQVFPLAQTDYVRTRLTHSLEVSSVARSIGSLVGQYILDKYSFDFFSSSDIGTILAAAALAHDIGNPPFGHAGEDGISQFFNKTELGHEVLANMHKNEQEDLLHFEGNAQAFRLLSRLQNNDNEGGMQLTLSTIGTFVKYPCGSSDRLCADDIAVKKFNYFQAEKDIFKSFAKEVGLKQISETRFARHPFAFLLEASDDICYTLVDVEDAYRLSLISGQDVIAFYELIVKNHGGFPEKLHKIKREKDKIEYLRAYVMGLLIDEVVESFKQNEASILAGDFKKELLHTIPSASALMNIKRYAYDNIYVSKPVLEVGIAGLEVIEKLLTAFVGAVNQEATKGSTAKSRMLLHFIPDQFLGVNRSVDEDPYVRILKITDFISGMTDRYAVHVYKMISGADLSS